VEDVVRATLATIERRVPHRIMSVCSGEPVSTRALAERIRLLCGSCSSVCHASRRPDDLARVVPDATRLRELFEPTSLNIGLANTVAWFAARYASYALRTARASRRALSNSAYFMPSIAGE
jgi:nucleoside-diphosphate-sugar epimerase